MKLYFVVVVLHLPIATASKMKFGDILNALTGNEVSSHGDNICFPNALIVETPGVDTEVCQNKGYYFL